MSGVMKLRIWDVQHGACAMLLHTESKKLAMIDSGHNHEEQWFPSKHIKTALGRDELDYLFITNADHDHMSDLDGLWTANVKVKALIRNKNISSADLRAIKEESAGGAKLSNDIERYLKIHDQYSAPLTETFESQMSGIQYHGFTNSYPTFKNTNDLSLAAFFEYGSFKVLFPGDLERAGWLAMLQKPKFVEHLKSTDVLIASHHGRQSGYCEEVFEHLKPRCVIFSDKQVEHETQKGMSKEYGEWCSGVQLTDGSTRKVLTTRDDGWIHLDIDDQQMRIKTERISG